MLRLTKPVGSSDASTAACTSTGVFELVTVVFFPTAPSTPQQKSDDPFAGVEMAHVDKPPAATLAQKMPVSKTSPGELKPTGPLAPRPTCP